MNNAENQSVEYKVTWRDEYLKWICAFANSQGGALQIGIDDRGQVVGLDNATRLLEELPNKIKSLLGILATVDLIEEDKKQWIRISVPAYPFPISYKGEYHIRSGSTKQVLCGTELDRFLLAKAGRRWDSVPLPDVTVSDLSQKRLRWFRGEAVTRNRLSHRSAENDHQSLIEKLHLFEGELLKRAAVLLFHCNPEKYFTGASVKIGYFKSDSQLMFQDVIDGDLFSQIEKTIELLTTKYLQASLSINGTQHHETLPLPVEALREAVVNAIAHKDYSSATPIQISVYDDKLMIWNSGRLPENWTIDRLYQKHPSLPYNPDIADKMFRVGNIEAWGTGISRMMMTCEEHGCPAPVFAYETIGLMLTLGYRDQVGTKSGQNRDKIATKLRQNRDQVGTKSGPSRDQVTTLKKCQVPHSLTELLAVVGRSNRTKFRNQILQPLMEAGLIEMTIPEKPNSRFQKYQTTDLGKAVINE